MPNKKFYEVQATPVDGAASAAVPDDLLALAVSRSKIEPKGSSPAASSASASAPSEPKASDPGATPSPPASDPDRQDPAHAAQ
ncbi:MAG: hypothetical protein V4675_16115 [Verrucomicrobiota bacterium]